MTYQEYRELERERMRAWLVDLLREAGGSKRHAAKLGGIYRTSLYRMIRRFDLSARRRVSAMTLCRSSELINRPPFNFVRSAGGQGGYPPTSYSTSFESNENPISESSHWLNGGTVGLQWKNVRTNGGEGLGADFSSNDDDCVAILTNHAIPVDHEAEFTVHRVGGYMPTESHETQLFLRAAISANSCRGYEILCPFGGGIQVMRWNGALHDFTEITGTGSGPPTTDDGDKIRAKIVGSTITVYHTPFGGSESQVHTTTDSTWTDGSPGMAFFVRSSGTLASYCMKDWRAGPAT